MIVFVLGGLNVLLCITEFHSVILWACPVINSSGSIMALAQTLFGMAHFDRDMLSVSQEHFLLPGTGASVLLQTIY